MPRRKTREEFILEAIQVHNNKYEYSKVDYKNNNTNVIITCPVHGDFLQMPKMHLKGRGCRRCASVKNGEFSKLSKDEFVKRAISRHGDFYDYSKVNYINNYTKVDIICPIHGVFSKHPFNHLRGKGCPLCSISKVKNKTIGVNDTYSKATSKFYRTWNSMIDRCYNTKTQSKHPTYKNCTVCDEWLTFSNFERWCNSHYKKGWELDKDLLVKGNNEYSPDKCCYIPRAINSFLTNKKSRRGDCVIGVSKSTCGKKYIATLGCLSKPHLGTFDSEIEAFRAYKIAKENKARELANNWKEQIEPNVYNALINFQVEITD